jgi:plastocyanin
MRKLILLTVALFALATSAPAVAAESISITPTGFTPTQVTIGPGDTVTWTNNDTADRSVVSDTGAFNSQTIRPGTSWTFRFARAGTFAYHDGTRAAEKGTVTVRRTGTRTVTIAAARKSVVAGSTVELSGTLSGGRAGQQITIIAKPDVGGETRATTLTDSDGTWRLVVRPRIRTEYRAQAGATTSSEAPIIFVRPGVQLRVLSARSGRFYTKVSALRSYRGKTVTVQRLSGETWVRVKRVRLGANSAVRFTARLPRTARIRVLVPSSPGYLQGFSRTALVRR